MKELEIMVITKIRENGGKFVWFEGTNQIFDSFISLMFGKVEGEGLYSTFLGDEELRFISTDENKRAVFLIC